MNIRKLGVIGLLGSLTAWNGYVSLANLWQYTQTKDMGSLLAASGYGSGALLLGAMTIGFAAINDREYSDLEREAMKEESKSSKEKQEL